MKTPETGSIVLFRQAAEIERLKQGKNILSDLLYKEEARANGNESKIERLKDLVAEMDAALRSLGFPSSSPLLRRAWEAVK